MFQIKSNRSTAPLPHLPLWERNPPKLGLSVFGDIWQSYTHALSTDNWEQQLASEGVITVRMQLHGTDCARYTSGQQQPGHGMRVHFWAAHQPDPVLRTLPVDYAQLGTSPCSVKGAGAQDAQPGQGGGHTVPRSL